MLGGFVFVVWFICPILWGMSISLSLIYLCLLFTFRYSQECFLLTIYAHIRGRVVRQHW